MMMMMMMMMIAIITDRKYFIFLFFLFPEMKFSAGSLAQNFVLKIEVSFGR